MTIEISAYNSLNVGHHTIIRQRFVIWADPVQALNFLEMLGRWAVAVITNRLDSLAEEQSAKAVSFDRWVETSWADSNWAAAEVNQVL